MQRISNRKISQTFFIFFILAVGIHKSNFIINEFTGLDIQSIIQISLLLFPLPFLFIAYRYSSSIKINTKKNNNFVPSQIA